MRLLLAFAISFASSAIADDKPTEIPLKSVHALSMPGTLDVRKLDNKGLVEAIRKTLRQPPAKPDCGIAVQGKGEDALQQFFRIRVEGQKRPALSAGDDVSLVFFSYQLGVYVHLDKVEQSGNKFIVRWRPVYHDEQILTNHLAIIPLGTLPTGKYEVEVKQSSPHKEQREFFRNTSQLEKYVSQSFKFEVNTED